MLLNWKIMRTRFNFVEELVKDYAMELVTQDVLDVLMVPILRWGLVQKEIHLQELQKAQHLVAKKLVLIVDQNVLEAVQVVVMVAVLVDVGMNVIKLVMVDVIAVQIVA